MNKVTKVLMVLCICSCFLAGSADAAMWNSPYGYNLPNLNGFYVGGIGPTCLDENGQFLPQGTPVYIHWTITGHDGTGKLQVLVQGGDIISNIILIPGLGIDMVSKAVLSSPDVDSYANIYVTISDYTGTTAPYFEINDCFQAR